MLRFHTQTGGVRPSPPSSPRTTSSGSTMQSAGRRPRRHARACTPTAMTRPSGFRRRGRQNCAAHPADRRLRVRRGRHGRSLGRLVLRGVAHRRGGAGGKRYYLERIEQLGGAVAAIEARFMQEEIEAAAYSFAKAVDDGEKVVVGVNRFTDDRGRTHRGVPDRRQAPADPDRPHAVGSGRAGPGRGGARPGRRRRRRREADGNLLVPMKEALKQMATLGEVSDVLRAEFGVYQPGG